MSLSCLNLFVFIPRIRRFDRLTETQCDWSAKGLRRVRDTCDDFAFVLRGFMRDKNFGHVQKFCKPFATSLQMMRVEVAVYFDKNYIAHYIHIKCSNV